MRFEEYHISAISRFFSPSVLRELSRKGRSPLFARLLDESSLARSLNPDDKVSEVFEKAYSLLKNKRCRHEYVYKAALTEKVLLGIHSLQTASMLTEFRVGKCKADYAILNGTATVYEIKSERDTLSRLEYQVNSYMKVFARVNVIAGENHIDDVVSIVPKEVGVLKLSDRHQISTLREAVDAPQRTCPATIFESIQLREANEILRTFGVYIPNVPNTELYEVLRNEFIKLPPCDAHQGMVKTLRVSRNLHSLSALLKDLPPSLHAAALSTSIRKKDHNKLVDAVNLCLEEAIGWAYS